jgi:hypothetical protein
VKSDLSYAMLLQYYYATPDYQVLEPNHCCAGHFESNNKKPGEPTPQSSATDTSCVRADPITDSTYCTYSIWYSSTVEGGNSMGVAGICGNMQELRGGVVCVEESFCV